MDTSGAIRTLRGAGVLAVPESSSTLRAEDGGEIILAPTNRPPTPSSVRALVGRLKHGERVLYSVKTITPSLRAAALADDRIIVASDDELILNGTVDALNAPEPPESAPRRGPRPYGEFAVARALLSAQRPLVQEEIAGRAGITQPAVSGALKRLGPLVRRLRVGWEAADRIALFDYAATQYPGAGGITTYWWHDADVRAQASTIADAAVDPLVGGDVAASTITGWRVPEHALVYTRSGVDPTRHGFVAATRDDHTLELVVPADETLWATAAAFRTPLYTDPVITVFDVRRTGITGDQDEAADRVRANVLGSPHSSEV